MIFIKYNAGRGLMRKQIRIFIFKVIFAFVLFAGLYITPVYAAEVVSYHNLTTDSAMEYDDVAVKYQYNNTDVTMSDIGILGESGSALAPMADLFVQTLNVECEFCLSDSSVLLKDGSNHVKIMPGDTNANVNGVSVTMSEAPVLLKNQLNQLLYYVPSRFIASNLGFDYEWKKELSTVFISREYTIRYTSDFTGQPITLPVNEGITTNDIHMIDKYYQNEIVVCIPGNYVETYADNCLENHYPEITDVELYLTANNETQLVFKTSKIVACQAEVKDNNLYVSFLAPQDAYSKIVVIDPGHGGYDPGAIRDKINECDLNLSIAYEYTKDLFADSDIKVYYTRVNNKFVSLDDRAAFASKVGADFFVSVHQNTFTAPTKKGVSVYYSSDNKNVGPTGLTGRTMAGTFAERLSEKLGLNNLGRLNQRLSVTTYNTVPAALIELAFMSHPDDFSKLKDAEFRKQAGQAIYDTIVEIFEAYPTNR